MLLPHLNPSHARWRLGSMARHTKQHNLHKIKDILFFLLAVLIFFHKIFTLLNFPHCVFPLFSTFSSFQFSFLFTFWYSWRRKALCNSTFFVVFCISLVWEFFPFVEVYYIFLWVSLDPFHNPFSDIIIILDLILRQHGKINLYILVVIIMITFRYEFYYYKVYSNFSLFFLRFSIIVFSLAFFSLTFIFIREEFPLAHTPVCFLRVIWR